MSDWLESVAGPTYASAMMWTLGALVLLLVVLVLIKIVRSLTFGTFVAGGRNRKTRLAVMDATAVDSQRRLVLVRRDDVEHLILIGGPTDVVVEQNIRLAAPLTRTYPDENNRVREERPPAAPASPIAPVPAPVAPAPIPPVAPAPAPVVAAAPPPAPRPSQPEQPPRPQISRDAQGAGDQPRRPAEPPPIPVRPAAPAAERAPAPVPPAPQPAPRPAPPAAANAAPPPPGQRQPQRDLNDDLLRELEVTLDTDKRGAAEPEKPKSIEDEMSKLLGELSGNKR